MLFVDKLPPPRGTPHPSQAVKPTGCAPVDGSKLWDKVEYLPDGTTLYTKGSQPCVFLCVHGAGHSGLSFTLLAEQVKEFATVISYDIRGHGNSKHADGDKDLSIATLVEDCLSVAKHVMAANPESTVVLLGHSLGGSIAVRAARRLEDMAEGARVVALITIDVVEGTAMEYLPAMMDILNARPKEFPSLESAVKWATYSKVLSNPESARISIPPQLIEAQGTDGLKTYIWRNNLVDSSKFWPEWFQGLSSAFLKSKYSKICFIAARERLDKELEIANMQGKFRLISLDKVGHCMMEDDPVGVARNLHNVLERFRCPLSTKELQWIKENGIAHFKNNLKAYSKNK